MPVLKCPNGKYRIGSGLCIYKTKEKALRAYSAVRAISHSEALIEYVRFVVERIKQTAEDTTTGDIATFIRIARKIKRKNYGVQKDAIKKYIGE